MGRLEINFSEILIISNIFIEENTFENVGDIEESMPSPRNVAVLWPSDHASDICLTEFVAPWVKWKGEF